MPFALEAQRPVRCANTRAAYARASRGRQRKLPLGARDDRLARLDDERPHAGLEKWVIPEMDKRLHEGAQAARPRTRRSSRCSTRWPSATTTRSRSSARAGRPHAHDLPRREARARRRWPRASRRSASRQGDRVVLSRAEPPGLADRVLRHPPRRGDGGAGRPGARRRRLGNAARRERRARRRLGRHGATRAQRSRRPHAGLARARPARCDGARRRGARRRASIVEPERRREPHLHERHDRRAQGRDALARELHVARRGARAALPARRAATACSACCRCTTRSSSPAACSCRSRAARASSTSTSSPGDGVAEGLQRGAHHRDGRRARALAAARAAHLAAGRRAGPARASGLRRRRSS